jgi:hypothetical protein
LTAIILAGAIAAAWWLFLPRDALQIQILDVDGYRDDLKTWMGLRVTIGLTNTGRDLVTIRRIHVEPDFADFNEAYAVGVYELTPPLVVEPGSRLSYQATTTLLNATQLPWRTHPLTLRVRVERNGTEVEQAFPAEFDHAQDPQRRSLRF